MGQFDAVLGEVQNFENFLHLLENYSQQIDEQWENTYFQIKDVFGFGFSDSLETIITKIYAAQQLLGQYAMWLDEAYRNIFLSIDQFSNCMSNLLNYLPGYITHLQQNSENCLNALKSKDETILQENFYDNNILNMYVSTVSSLLASTYAEMYNNALLLNVSSLISRSEKIVKKSLKEVYRMKDLSQSELPQLSPDSNNSIIKRVQIKGMKFMISSCIKKRPSFGAELRKLTKKLGKMTICTKAYNKVYDLVMNAFTDKNGSLSAKRDKMELAFFYVFQNYAFLVTSNTKSKADDTFRKFIRMAYDKCCKGGKDIQQEMSDQSENYVKMKIKSLEEFSNIVEKHLETDGKNIIKPYSQKCSHDYFAANTIEYYAKAVKDSITTGMKVKSFFMKLFGVIFFLLSIISLGFTVLCVIAEEYDIISFSVIFSFVIGVLSIQMLKDSSLFNMVIKKAKKISFGVNGNSPFYQQCSETLINSQLSKVEFYNPNN